MDIQLQLEKSICEIIKDDKCGVGFFCKINYKGNEIDSLITNCNTITETMLYKDYIEIKTSNKKIKREYLNKKKWMNKHLNYVCIEISKNEDIEILEIENNFAFNENGNEDCDDKDMTVVSINKDKKIEVLNGKLIDIEKCHKFYYPLNIEKGLSGVTYILNNNLKIIGIFYGNEIKEKMIEGIYINKIVKDINRYNLIEGIIDIKNNLLFYSEGDILCEVYFNNKKVKMINDGKKYTFPSFLYKGEYEFKIYFYNLKNNINFRKSINLKNIDFTYFDTSYFTDMSYMFSECNGLEEIKGINKFNTSKVTNMKAMFQKCSKLVNLDLNFDTSLVIDMGFMFNGCNELKKIKGINKFNTSKVTNMKAMFQNCSKLVNLNLNFDSSNVTDMSYMFNGCNELKKIKGIYKFNTSKVTNMKAMFQNCCKLVNLNLNFDTSHVKNLMFMFNRCKKLK